MSKIGSFFQTKENKGTDALTIENEAEACAAVLMACRRADEIDGGGGNAVFMATLQNRNIFIGSDPAELIEKAAQYFEQAGSSETLINAAMPAIRQQTRLPLFYQCLDVILADGVVTPKEDKIFKYLIGKFKVNKDLAFQALEVLLVKNQL
ncbi:MAG: TerB family tellurite resistance protein [Lewinellaceae bacterium]|nr:TerB family tellurite resistance protein [Saprospiraceae bacterium]MCB9344015.1 TerB family tellurite resistance protein [Lewinellaceae bacterium]